MMPRTLLAFLIGFGAALAAGWGALPRILYQAKAQPVVFPHKTHAAKSGTAQCGDCHTIREDGAFAGIPATQNCAGCHAEPMGTSAAEAVLVSRYVKPHRETPWLVYAEQPANVRFSHAIHVQRGGLACAKCHGAHGESNGMPAKEINRISGYGREVRTMSDCEDCHREKKVEAGCLGCHK